GVHADDAPAGQRLAPRGDAGVEPAAVDERRRPEVLEAPLRIPHHSLPTHAPPFEVERDQAVTRDEDGSSGDRGRGGDAEPPVGRVASGPGLEGPEPLSGGAFESVDTAVPGADDDPLADDRRSAGDPRARLEVPAQGEPRDALRADGRLSRIMAGLRHAGPVLRPVAALARQRPARQPPGSRDDPRGTERAPPRQPW